MADATLRGRFELSAEGAIRDLHSIRDAGVGADASLDALGRRMDEIGRKRITPRIELSGFDRVNLQLSELERRLDRFGRRRVSAHVGIGGGFSSFTGGGGGGPGGAGGAGGLFSSLGGIPGMLPWWAMAAPLVPQLLGGAGALIGSAGAGALGAGVVGLGGAGALGAGAIPTALIARNAVKDLGAVTKAQTAYNSALQAFGRQSTQAAAAKRRLDLALVSAPPGAAGAARQVSGVESAFRSATRPAYTAIYRTIAQGAYDVRRALPQVAPLINRSASVTGSAVSDYAGFLTNQQSLNSYRQLVAGFAQDLPPIERSAQNLTRLFLNLSTDALPFFHEGTVWLESWTRHMANQSQDQAAVQRRMRELVSSARDWEHLLGAAGRDLKDLFGPSVAPGNSMVVTFTNTLDRWDTWLRDNPQKVRQFFDDGVRGTERIATVVGNLTKDVWQIFQALSPILTRAEQFLSFASGLGGGSLALGGALLYGGYQGVRGAFGGRGPSAGSALGTFILGPSARGTRSERFGGGAVVGGMQRVATRATNLEAARGATSSGMFLMGPASVGPDAVLARRAEAAAAADASRVQRLTSDARAWMMRRPLTAGALDVLGTAGGAARGLAGGAMRFALPVLAINALLNALQPTSGGLGARVQNAASGLTLGLIPSYVAPGAEGAQRAQRFIAGLPPGADPYGAIQQRIGIVSAGTAAGSIRGAVVPVAGATARDSARVTGADWRSRFVPSTGLSGRQVGEITALAQAQMNELATHANNVRTPQQAASVRQMVAQVRLELPPSQQARFSKYLDQIATTAAQNAGHGAAQGWESAFETGLTRMPPSRAVTMALRGMPAQISSLLRSAGPQGARAFAADEAQWAQQMIQANPALQKPMTRLMRGIVDDVNRMSGAVKGHFRDLQREIFFFNGQILQGSATTWQAIGKALTDPASVAQAKLSGIFGQIQGEAVNALTSMGFSQSQARQLVTGVASGKISQATVGQGVRALGNLNRSNVPGAAGIVTGAINLGRRPNARGGVIGGRGLLDTVPTPDGGLAAPGEAWIANRHTMGDLSRATVAMYGKTAWQMIRDEGRPHSAPLYRAALGVAGAPTHSGAGWVQAQHPELHAGIAQAVERVLSRFPLSITSTTGGSHAPGSYHYLGEAADIAGASGTMYSAAQWIKSSGLARGLTEGIHNPNLAVKYGQVQSPPGVFGAVWGGHLNHIHMAVAGALSAAASGGAGGARGQMPGSVRLRAPRSGLGGVPGALADRASQIYAAAMQQHVNQQLGGTAGASGFTGGGSARANQELGRRMMLSWGWPASEWPSLLALGNQESGWDANAVNPSSGAYGIGQCVPLRTKILTRRGWLGHDEVEVGDETIGFNPETGKSEWTRVSAVHHPGRHPVQRFGTSWWSAECTPNHRWLMRKEGRLRHQDRGLDLVELRDRSTRHRVVLAVPADTGEGLPISLREAALLGWLAGEGWRVERKVTPRQAPDARGRRNRYRPMTFHLSQTKTENWSAIDAAVGEHGRVTRTRNGHREWRLSAPYARDLVARAGDPKDDAVAMVLAMSAEQREVWLEAITRAEGGTYTGTSGGSCTQITQCEGGVADAIILAVYLCGNRPSIYRNERADVPTWNPCLTIGVCEPQTGRMDHPGYIDEEVGEQEVWCVTTELGSWTAEQDGNVFLTGNSLGHGHPYRLGDAPAQIAWMLNYVRHRYGSPSAAEAHERAYHWYGRGGRLNFAGWNEGGGDFITHGPTVFGAGEKGKRERVTITPVGRAGGRSVAVHFNGPVYARDRREVEALGEMVAGKILDALDRVGAGTSDGELMAGAA